MPDESHFGSTVSAKRTPVNHDLRYFLSFLLKSHYPHLESRFRNGLKILIIGARNLVSQDGIEGLGASHFTLVGIHCTAEVAWGIIGKAYGTGDYFFW
jgi:hypothetical protein